jgi:hypothetical protein
MKKYGGGGTTPYTVNLKISRVDQTMTGEDHKWGPDVIGKDDLCPR